ncbi:hypothetical protein HU200_038973 [Digitaria exilis]|uniref:AAA+ ATPase domain-containing protein n=1 Tax=Digitaria exilis TaxID=1010633 RepID=A0A835BC58_9POAL|nr:hypothetical protein HU200_038973 [Digitaria exilis]
MASYDKAIESYKNGIATAASFAASLMLVRGVVHELVPPQLREVLFSHLGYLRWWHVVSPHHTIVIEQRTDDGLTNNHMYSAVKTYLATRISSTDRQHQQRLRVSSMDENDKMLVAMAEGEEMADVYDGTEFKWRFVSREIAIRNGHSSSDIDGGQQEVRSFELSFNRRHKEKALKSYLPFIVSKAKAIKDQERSLQIYMNQYTGTWSPVDLRHPSTFDTLAMDQKLKRSIIDDLDRFIKRKDYYKRIGKAWKRGYLLYGPPGTGKSSLIAAMDNYLRFDIYDLDLTEVQSNSDLRRLLIGMSNRSIIVAEDIDCSVEMKQREGHELKSAEEEKEEQKVSLESEYITMDNLFPLLVKQLPYICSYADKKMGYICSVQVTLSGLLNFVDGLWSASGEGRIIIFTTNYKERLDPALLRPGRMDMHILMGYCTAESFRILASNYHSISYHVTFPEIEELITEAMVTPAEVAEVLMRSDDTDAVLQDVVDLLKSKVKHGSEINKAGHKDAKHGSDGDEK